MDDSVAEGTLSTKNLSRFILEYQNYSRTSPDSLSWNCSLQAARWNKDFRLTEYCTIVRSIDIPYCLQNIIVQVVDKLATFSPSCVGIQ